MKKNKIMCKIFYEELFETCVTSVKFHDITTDMKAGKTSIC